jgi:iron complex transport system substrate-binding protein
MDIHNQITYDIIGSALRIHTKLGPGLFESVYHAVLVRDLRNKQYIVDSEKPVPLIFEDLFFEKTFYADIVVNRKVLVEVKSEGSISSVHIKQTLTYARLLDLRYGLILNFGTPSLGIKRIAN